MLIISHSILKKDAEHLAGKHKKNAEIANDKS